MPEQVLPDQHRQPERRGDRTARRPDDHQGGHHTSGEQQHDHEDQRQRRHHRDHQVVLLTVGHIPERGGGSPEIHLGVRQRGLLEPFLGGGPLGADPVDALWRHRVALVSDEEPHRLSVGGEEHLHTANELRVGERLGRQVEEVVVLRLVEALPHHDGGVTHRLHLVDHRFEGLVHGQRQTMRRLQRLEHDRDQLLELVRTRPRCG